MDSPYRPQESITNQKPANSAIPVLAGLLWLAVLFSPGASAADAEPRLQPYTANYQTTARGFDLSITRTLEVDENGLYVLTNGGKILVVGFQEVSVFRVESGQIQPISYIFRGTGVVTRRRELRFSPDQGKIDSLYKGDWYELPFEGATLDRMNQLEQLRLELLKSPDIVQDLTMRVADGKRVKDSRLVFIAEEILRTPLGPISTLHYERLHDNEKRKSDIWFAPDWDYLMVRTVHIEDGEPVEMMIRSATLDGQPVSIGQ